MKPKVSSKQVKKAAKQVIIVTGPSGAGKSSVSRLLAARGYKLIKGDEVARSLYRPGSGVSRALLRSFGPSVFSGKRLNRARLGALVFSSRQALNRLNAIVHPALNREIALRLRGAKKAVVDMAVYFAAGAANFGGHVVLVTAPLALRIRRLRERGLEPARAKGQARALKFGNRERRRCVAVILNTGSRNALRQKLEKALRNFS